MCTFLPASLFLQPAKKLVYPRSVLFHLERLQHLRFFADAVGHIALIFDVRGNLRKQIPVKPEKTVFFGILGGLVLRKKGRIKALQKVSKTHSLIPVF
ncbi:MAG: hypothetical protein ACOC7X_01855 [Spirochaetota bacterium]